MKSGLPLRQDFLTRTHFFLAASLRAFLAPDTPSYLFPILRYENHEDIVDEFETIRSAQRYHPGMDVQSDWRGKKSIPSAALV